MNENLAYAKMFAQFPFALRRFMRQRLTLTDPKRIGRERMRRCDDSFLQMVERNVYGVSNSPYRKLLQQAGCELNDLPNYTSGSSGAAVKVAIDLTYSAERASNRFVAWAAHGLLGMPTGMWRGILPDRTMGQLLYSALIGQMPQRWFSPIGLRDSAQWVKDAVGTYQFLVCAL